MSAHRQTRESQIRRFETRGRRQREAAAMLPGFDSASKAELAIIAVRLGALASGNCDDYEAGARVVLRECLLLREQWASGAKVSRR